MILIDDHDIPNRFEAALVVAKRSRAIIDGSPIILEPGETNAVSQAVKEYLGGMIKTGGMQ